MAEYNAKKQIIVSKKSPELTHEQKMIIIKKAHEAMSRKKIA